jgi:hypothetical protein
VFETRSRRGPKGAPEITSTKFAHRHALSRPPRRRSRCAVEPAPAWAGCTNRSAHSHKHTGARSYGSADGRPNLVRGQLPAPSHSSHFAGPARLRVQPCPKLNLDPEISQEGAGVSFGEKGHRTPRGKPQVFTRSPAPVRRVERTMRSLQCRRAQVGAFARQRRPLRSGPLSLPRSRRHGWRIPCVQLGRHAPSNSARTRR